MIVTIGSPIVAVVVLGRKSRPIIADRLDRTRGQEVYDMSEAENIALYRRFVEDGVGIGRLEVLDELFDPDIALPTLAPALEPTLAGLRQFNEAVRMGIPDATARIDEIIADGDWVGAKVTWSGTQTGEFLGIPASGRTFSVTEFEIVRCEAGRIVEARSVIDVARLVGQLAPTEA